jgi:hypothetical protein
MPHSKGLDLKSILVQDVGRVAKAESIAEAIRSKGSYRWVGIYDVDIQGGLVSNIDETATSVRRQAGEHGIALGGVRAPRPD